jgi:serine/threonine-protein kinase
MVIGRYALYDAIAAGGMATVHFGRLLGPVGFSRLVAVKRLHPEFSRDREFVSMFIDEARLAARIRHPNVVQTLDVVATEGEVFLVLEYVQGESLSQLLRATRQVGPMPVPIACAIVCGVLNGLHAAHEATDTQGQPLGIVHCDVSPQNVLVGVDGIARVLDFGIALATAGKQTTGDGKLRGKFGYMAPEHIDGNASRQSDIFATGVVLWEVLTGKRLFGGEDPKRVFERIKTAEITPPRKLAPHLPAGIDEVVMRALERDLTKRYATAHEMATDLEACLRLASLSEVGAWVELSAHNAIAERTAAIAEIESLPSGIVDLSQQPSMSTGSGPPQTPVPDAATVANGGQASAALIAPVPMLMPVSEPSSPGLDAPPFRTRTLRVALILTAAVGVVAGVLIALDRSNASEPAASPTGSTASASATTSSEPLQTASVPAPTVASAEPSSSQRPPEARTAFRPAAAPPAFLPPSRSKSMVDCNPPYSLDADGHKRWKRQCF